MSEILHEIPSGGTRKKATLPPPPSQDETHINRIKNASFDCRLRNHTSLYASGLRPRKVLNPLFFSHSLPSSHRCRLIFLFADWILSFRSNDREEFYTYGLFSPACLPYPPPPPPPSVVRQQMFCSAVIPHSIV